MFKRILLGIIPFIVLSCAQTKTLTGGPTDEIAPVPLAMVPDNESIFFNNNRVVITFDEYIKLNNSAQNITIVPNDVKLKSYLKNKSVIIDLDGTLRNNTTYSIFINRAIQDIHEGRDSIMQYVFSTGSFIDSLTYNCFLLDAITTQPVNGVTIGLFEHKDSLKPIYFTQSDNGHVRFNYLKNGEYYLRAFNDENRDGKIGPYENVAFHEEMVQIPQKDTVNLRYFTPLLKPDITTFNFSQPGMFVVAANRPISQDSIYLNDIKIDASKTKWFKNDSLVIFDNGIVSQSNKILLQNEWIDSAKIRLNTVRTKTFSLYGKSIELAPKDSFTIYTNGEIQALDTTKVKWVNLKDTSSMQFNYRIEKNEIVFYTNTKFEKSKINIYNDAVKVVEEWKSAPYEALIQQLNKTEVGELTILLDFYKEPIILEIFNGPKLFKSMYIEQPNALILEDLSPKEYTFRVIIDKNKNGQWDTGDFFTGIQPEEVHIYSTPTKVRGNWEIEVQLEPLKEDESEN